MPITRALPNRILGLVASGLGKTEQKPRRPKHHFHYEFDATLRSLREKDSTRPLDQFLRYQSFLQTRISWSGFDFRNKTILEIGCGPLLGWAPLAVYSDCREYICIEPGLQSKFAYRPEIMNQYYLPLYRQLEGYFRKGISFEQFRTRLIDHITIYRNRIEDCSLPNSSADVVFSNNVLQHVSDLDTCFHHLEAVSAPNARQFHKVHFTDHEGIPDRPFNRIYSISPLEYSETGNFLNLKRPSQIQLLFEEHHLPVTMVPFFSDDRLKPDDVHPYWKRFSLEDLRVHIGFFVSKCVVAASAALDSFFPMTSLTLI